MPDLPIDFSAGDILTASDLNNWKSDRSGNLLPISSSTLNYVNNGCDLGSTTYMWRYGYFSQNLGLGTVGITPSARLHAYKDSGDTIGLFQSLGHAAFIGANSSGWGFIGTLTSTVLYIVSGNTNRIVVETTGFVTMLGYQTIQANDVADTTPPSFKMRKSRAGGAVSSNDYCGSLESSFYNSAAVEKSAFKILTQVNVATSGSENVYTYFQQLCGTGSFQTVLQLSNLGDVVVSQSATVTSSLSVGGNASITGQLSAPNQIRCSLYKSASQTLATATDAAVTWDTELSDVGGLHSTSSNTSRVTVTSDGNYLVEAVLAYEAGSSFSGLRYAKIKKNGSTDLDSEIETVHALPSGYQKTRVSAVLTLSASDYIEVIARQESGFTIAIGGGLGYSSLKVTKIS